MKLHLSCGHIYLESWVNFDGPKDELRHDDIRSDLFTKIEDLNYLDNGPVEFSSDAGHSFQNHLFHSDTHKGQYQTKNLNHSLKNLT